ncbi:hypothetical protein [Kribbella yunnanensis]
MARREYGKLSRCRLLAEPGELVVATPGAKNRPGLPEWRGG